MAKPDGSPGVTIQDWLVGNGFEAPRAARGLGNAKDASAAQLSSAGAGASGLDAARRRSSSAYRRSESGADGKDGAKEGGGGGGASKGPRVHRSGCMCIICKQARGFAGAGGSSREDAAMGAAGTTAGSTGAAATAGAAPAAAAAPAKYRHRGPVVRYGKRAYVRAVPHICGGMRFHKPWRVPQGSAWTPEEWAATRLEAVVAAEDAAAAELGDEEEKPILRAKAEEGVKEEAGTAVATGVLGAVPPTQPQAQGGSAQAAQGAALQGAAGGEPTAASGPAADGPVSSVVVKTEPGTDVDVGKEAAAPAEGREATPAPTNAPTPSATEGGPGGPSASTGAPGASTGTNAGGGAGAGPSGKPAGRTRASVPWRERLKKAREQEPTRLTFGKSGIHGWGLFALKELPQDSLVIEYRGESIRSSLSDLREAGYRATGRDCYLFRASDAVVVDSTMHGSWSRFTNHCCAPSLYTKVGGHGVQLCVCCEVGSSFSLNTAHGCLLQLCGGQDGTVVIHVDGVAAACGCCTHLQQVHVTVLLLPQPASCLPATPLLPAPTAATPGTGCINHRW